MKDTVSALRGADVDVTVVTQAPDEPRVPSAGASTRRHRFFRPPPVDPPWAAGIPGGLDLVGATHDRERLIASWWSADAR